MLLAVVVVVVDVYLARLSGNVGLSGGVSPPWLPPTTICCNECFFVTLLKGAPSLRGPRGDADVMPLFVLASIAAVEPADADGTIPIVGVASIDACTQPTNRNQIR